MYCEAMKNSDRKTPYTSVSVTPGAKAVLRGTIPQLTGIAGRVVTASEALTVLAAVAMAHPDELKTWLDAHAQPTTDR
jgi:hypothetical protein